MDEPKACPKHPGVALLEQLERLSAYGNGCKGMEEERRWSGPHDFQQAFGHVLDPSAFKRLTTFAYGEGYSNGCLHWACPSWKANHRHFRDLSHWRAWSCRMNWKAWDEASRILCCERKKNHWSEERVHCNAKIWVNGMVLCGLPGSATATAILTRHVDFEK